MNKKWYFLFCVAISLGVCAAQVSGQSGFLICCLIAFLGLTALCCWKGVGLPLLLFFLPWSQILRMNAHSFSFYTVALMMVCIICLVKRRFAFKSYGVALGLVLMGISLVSKLIDGSAIDFSYIAFIALVITFPVIKEEYWEQNYTFFELVLYFSVGIVLAALCAQRYAGYSNIAQFIRVDSYSTITRMCGFDGDPNFYSAQITAAIGGCLLLLLREKNWLRVGALGVVSVLLVYCGFLSGSKSFVLVLVLLLCLWYVGVLKIQGRNGMKIGLVLGSVLVLAFVMTSVLFSDLLDVLATRFSYNEDLSAITTGRTKLWMRYIRELLTNGKVLVIGKGFTNVMLGGRASHCTVLQILFQFGVIGGAVLAAWSVCFFWEAICEFRKLRAMRISIAILLVGAFLPWLAIDMLYFDEYFLMQWFVFAGCMEILSRDTRSELPAEANVNPL